MKRNYIKLILFIVLISSCFFGVYAQTIPSSNGNNLNFTFNTEDWIMFWKNNDYNTTQFLFEDVSASYQLGSTSISNVLEDSSNPNLGNRFSIVNINEMTNIFSNYGFNNGNAAGKYLKMGGNLTSSNNSREEIATKFPINLNNYIFMSRVFLEYKVDQYSETELPYIKAEIKVKYNNNTYASLPMELSDLFITPNTTINSYNEPSPYDDYLSSIYYDENGIRKQQISFQINFSNYIDFCLEPEVSVVFSIADSEDIASHGINAYVSCNTSTQLNPVISDYGAHNGFKLCINRIYQLFKPYEISSNNVNFGDAEYWVVTNTTDNTSQSILINNNTTDIIFDTPGNYNIVYKIVKQGTPACELMLNVANDLIIGNCEQTCLNCTSFDLQIGGKYLISGWINVMDEQSQGEYTRIPNLYTYDSAFIEVKYIDTDGLVINPTQEIKFYGNGEIIDGWQKIQGELIIPSDIDDIKIGLVNQYGNNEVVFFDDIRIHPYNANMKSFVYDQKTQRLMAELDENNYATFYEYDKEGGLVRVKKETEKGVYTIQETRSSTRKITE